MTPFDRWRMLRATATYAGIIVALTVMLTTPILVASLSDSITWIDLANIGQAYGGVAAVISGLALAGIAVSIFLQWRQLRLTQMFALRERTFELLKLRVEHADLLPGMSSPDHRVKLYANLFIGHLAMWWDLRATTEEAIRLELGRIFEAEAARGWWSQVGASWFGGRTTAHNRRFLSIVHDECQQAAARAESAQAQPRPPGTQRDEPEHTV